MNRGLIASQSFHPIDHFAAGMSLPGCLRTHFHFSKAALMVLTKMFEFRMACFNSVKFLKELEEAT